MKYFILVVVLIALLAPSSWAYYARRRGPGPRPGAGGGGGGGRGGEGGGGGGGQGGGEGEFGGGDGGFGGGDGGFGGGDGGFGGGDGETGVGDGELGGGGGGSGGGEQGSGGTGGTGGTGGGEPGPCKRRPPPPTEDGVRGLKWLIRELTAEEEKIARQEECVQALKDKCLEKGEDTDAGCESEALECKNILMGEGPGTEDNDEDKRSPDGEGSEQSGGKAECEALLEGTPPPSDEQRRDLDILRRLKELLSRIR